VNNCTKWLLLVLLVKPTFGFGQQAPASRFDSLVTTAQQAQAANDYAAAVNAYKQAAKIRADMPELWANLGLMQQQAGDIPGALLSFQQANRINPSLYVPNLFLGICYLHEGKSMQAIPFLIKAEKINRTDPQVPLALGRAYIATGKFSAAAEELGRATTVDPRLGSAWFTLGIALLDQVELDAFKMSAEGKESPFAGALYAESLQKQARFGEAATLYKSLLTLQPQPPCIHSELGFSLLREHDLPGAASEFAAERATHPECGLAFFGQARMAIDSGDSKRAAEILRKLWDRDHGFVESNAAIFFEGLTNEKVQAFAGIFADSQNNLIPADLRNALLSVFDVSGQASASSAPVPASILRRTAQEYYAAGEFQQCKRSLEPGMAALSAGQLRLLAACSFFTGDNRRASSAAAAMQALQPHSLEALYWSIQANERLALQSLARFQQLEPDSARSHLLLGDIYQQLERFDDAQTEYIKALALSPSDPAALLGLASAYLSNNKSPKAIDTAKLALALTPNAPEVNLVMAEAMLAQNQFAEAEPFLGKSLTVKPQMIPHMHALMGKVYAETGRPEDAIQQLRMALSDDTNGSLHYLLARLYRQIGDSKDASQALDQMKAIKQQRRQRGVKLVEDPDLSSMEASPGNNLQP
jgi:tetratricopeptide (TPR) repeat protein